VAIINLLRRYIREVKIESTPKMLNFNSDFNRSFLHYIPFEISYLHFSNRFDLALMVSEIKRVKWSQMETIPRVVTF
jgi:hypothetical protein